MRKNMDMETPLVSYFKEWKLTKKQSKELEAFAVRRIRFLRKDLLALFPKKILELGCGDGSLAREMKTLLRAEVYGVDLSEKALTVASKRGIIIKKADLNKRFPFGDRSFDLVISDQVIEHIYDTNSFISESRRVIKDSGRLIIITPNLSFWMNRILFLLGVYPIFLEVSVKNNTFGLSFLKIFMSDKRALGHIRVFNSGALIDLLRSEGFTIERIRGIPVPFALPPLIRFFYDILDTLFAKRVGFARDIMVIARKE